MEQRISLVTLGATNLARARGFYQALGWGGAQQPDDEVCFFQAGGMVFGYGGYSSGASRNSRAMMPMVMSPGWRVAVGLAVAIGLIFTNGGSSGSAQMTCRRLPNHCLILSMKRDYPPRLIYTCWCYFHCRFTAPLQPVVAAEWR